MTHGIEIHKWSPAQAGPRDKPGYGIDPDYMPIVTPSVEAPDLDAPDEGGPAADPTGEEAERSPAPDVERQAPREGVEWQLEPPPDEVLPSDP